MEKKTRLKAFIDSLLADDLLDKYGNFAKLAGVDPSCLSLAVQGKRRLSIPNWKSIVSTFPYTNIDWLLDRTDDKSPRTAESVLVGDFRERFNKVIQHYHKNDRAAFRKKLGISPQTMHTWRTKKLPEDVAWRLADAYPDLSIHWLLTGCGDFLLNTQDPEPALDKEKLSELKKHIADLKERIAELEDENEYLYKKLDIQSKQINHYISILNYERQINAEQ